MPPVRSMRLMAMMIRYAFFLANRKEFFSLFPYSYVICQLDCKDEMIVPLLQLPRSDGRLRFNDIHLCQTISRL